MPQPQPWRRERRYPPSPYPPRSEATAAYRRAYDLGWKHLATLTGSQVLDYEQGLPSGPEKRGYRDGATARWAYEERAARVEPDIRRAEREEVLRQRREWGQADRPY